MTLDVIHLRSPVGSLVPTFAVRVPREATLAETAQIMEDESVSAVIVGDRADAVVSERDLVRALACGLPPDSPIETVSTSSPITVEAATPIVEAAALMLNQQVRHLLVNLGGGSTGIVSTGALLAALLQASNPEIWLENVSIHVKFQPSDGWIG